MRDAHLYLHHYPRQEALADLMIETLVNEGAGQPFHQSSVLVQNRGMATWLRQKIASQHGLCMLVDFPLPGTFLNEYLPRLLGQDPPPLISPSQLTWMIYTTLPKLLKRPSFQTIRRYLEGTSLEHSQRKRLELADSLASLFDRYQVYRPEWIRSWEKGQTATSDDDEIWQKELWLELHSNDENLTHWGNFIDQLQRREPESLQPNLTKLPSSLHVFGMSNLPPCYVDFLYQLSHFLPIHVYWMNPVEGYWEDAPNHYHWLLEHALTDHDQITLANPLLASFGRMGREFIGALHGGTHSNYDWQETDFEPDELTPNDRGTALEHIQFDIHQNLHAPHLLPDNTVRIHSCHSPLREVESLRQHLLHTLASHPALDLSDFLITCPNIEDYAPAIEATFGAIPHDDPHYLSFKISDRSTPAREPSIAAFLEMFQLPNQRFTSKEALSLLEVDPISATFHIQQQHLPTLKHWINQTGIRWGIDREHVREYSGHHNSADWSWEAGLEKLMLGITMMGNNPTEPTAQLLWNNIPPFPDMEGSALSLLDSLTEFIHWIKTLRVDLQQQKSLTQWVEWSQQLIHSGFSSTQESETSMRPVRLALDELSHTAKQLRSKETLHASVFADQLSNTLHKSAPSHGFLSGSITFCEMSPMRAIPTQHLCILGLNADSYPRSHTTSPFDLTELERKTGDRSHRDDDHYLFLEAILSARSSLYLSYTGISIKDNTPLPASSALQTLLDAYPALQQALVQEKIHAFSPSYFLPPNHSEPNHLIQSRDLSMLETSITLSKTPTHPPTPKFNITATDQPRTVTISQLLASLSKSSTFFLKHNLDSSSRWLKGLVLTEETIELNALENYSLKQQLIQQGPLSTQQILAKQSLSQLPPAEIGHQVLTKTTDTVNELLENLPETTSLHIHVQLRDLNILGPISVQKEQPDTVQITSPGSIKASDYLKAWLWLLLLSKQTGKSAYAELYSPNDLAPQKLDGSKESTDEHLANLIQLFRQAHLRPIPHFPKTSFAYAKEVHKSKQMEVPVPHKIIAQRALKAAWNDQYSSQLGVNLPGESSQIDNTLLHDKQNPINEDFIHLSELIWAPILRTLHTE